MLAIRLTILFAAVNAVASIAPLRVMRVTPASPADPGAEITVMFDRPVAGDLDRVVAAEDVISIVPAVEGRAEWRDPVTLRFRPTQPLEPGATYRVMIAPRVEAIDGSRLEREHVFEFRVSPPRILAGSPVSDGLAAEHVTAAPVFSFLVSAAANPNALASGLSIVLNRSCGGGTVALEGIRQRRIGDTDPSNYRWAGRTSEAWADSTRDLRRVIEVRPVSPLPLGCSATLLVRREVGEAGGGPERWPFRTYGEFRVTAAHCISAQARWCPSGPLRVQFSTPVRGADVLRHVRIIPSIRFTVRDTADESAHWILDASLTPRTTYAIVVADALRDVFDQRLAGRPVRSVRTTGLAPTVQYEFGRMLVERQGLGTLAVQHVNVDTLLVTSIVVPDSMEADFLAQSWNWAEPWSRLLPFATQSNVAVRGGRDERRVSGVRVPVRRNGAAGGTLIAMQVSSPALDSASQRDRPIALVQVTDLAVHARIGTDEGSVWVTGVNDGMPRADVAVELFDQAGRIRSNARTDSNGIARLVEFRAYPGDIEACEGWCGGIEGYVAARLGADRAVVGIDAYDPDLAPWRFGVQGAWDEERQPATAALFTERGIYRPGEVVYAKAIVRDGALGALAPPARTDTIRILFQDRDGGEMADSTMSAGEFGTATTSFRLAPDAPLGTYSIQVQRRRTGDWKTVAWSNYQVAEYRPPEFLVDVQSPEGQRFAGDTAEVAVAGRYLFGAAMGNAQLTWSVRASPMPWGVTIPGAEEWRVGASVNWWEDTGESGPRITRQGVDTLDATGHVTLRIPLAASDDGRPLTTTVQATVVDANRQTVSAATSLTVHPAAFYLGARAESRTWFWTAGSPVRLQVIALRPDGERVSDVAVHAVVVRREWHRVRRMRAGQVEEIGGWVSDTVTTCDVRTATEPANCHFTPPAGGSYTVTFTALDGEGRVARTGLSRWAVGPDYVPWNDESQLRMEVVPDKQTYAVGDTATVFFASPFTDAEAWITVERERIIESHRIRITSGATTLRFAITEAYAPNAFVSILVVRGRGAEPGPLDDPGRPTLRVGYADLRVLPEVKRLEVEVEPLAATWEPADTARVRVRVRDRDGHGHRAEVTLWAVDEGVLALTGYRTPDPIDLLYARRGVGLRLASNLVSVSPQIPEGQKGQREPGGGGGGDAAGILRSRFETTAFFLGSVVTDAAGDAVSTAKLPDNLTTFRVMAVAVTAGDRYGAGESTFLVTRPLVARPALPRFVRDGDRFLAGAVINHRLGGSPEVEVAASAEGIRVDGGRRKKARLTPGRGAEVRFEFRAQAGDSARFTFSAEADEERDAVRIAVPVRPDFHPQATTIAGVLRDTTSVTFVLEDDVDDERSRLELSIGASPFAMIRGAQQELRVYPYYCTEQISSIALPVIALYRAEQLTGEDWTSGDAEVEVREAVRALLRRQTAEGGIGFWSPLDWTTPTLSAWAGRVLLEAKSSGIAVDSATLGRLADYLTRSLSEESWRRVAVSWWHDSLSNRLSERLAAADFLSRYGQPNVSAENTLLQQAGLMRWDDRVLLAEVLARRNQLEPARALLQSAWRNIRVEGRNAVLPVQAYRSHYFDSRARPAARLLTATLAVEPGHPLIGPLVETLLQQGRVEAASPWTTQDYGHIVLALLEFSGLNNNVVQPGITIRSGRRTVLARAPGSSRESAVGDTSVSLRRLIRRDEQGRNVVRLDLASQQGDGVDRPVYFFLTVREVPEGRQVNPIDRGIQVERWYESIDTREPIDRIEEGQLVRVRLRITVPADRRFVVLDDPLPAGLEPVDLSLRTVAPPGAGFPDYQPEAEEYPDDFNWWYGSWDAGYWSPFDHKELRDDRVIWSASYLWPGSYSATYLARATTAGTFVVPPAHAEEMYNPGVNGRTGGATFQVMRIER
ncbi:MAG: MG2 domain-containing protein [Longimicrobiales bacterium]